MLAAVVNDSGRADGFHTVRFDFSEPDTWAWVDVFDTVGLQVPVDIALHPFQGQVGVAVTGNSPEYPLTGAGMDFYTRCLRADGSLRWHDWHDHGDGPDEAVAMATDSEGNVFVTGKGFNEKTVTLKYVGNHVSGSEPAFVQDHPYGDEGENLVADIQVVGENVVTAERFWKVREEWPPGQDDNWSIHMLQRERSGGGKAGYQDYHTNYYHETPTALVTSDSGVYLVGQTLAVDTIDEPAYILAIRCKSGSHSLDGVWTRTFKIGDCGEEDEEYGTAIAVDELGNCFVAGIELTEENEEDIITIMWQADGMRRGTWTYDGGGVPDIPAGIAVWHAAESTWIATVGTSGDEGDRQIALLRYAIPGPWEWTEVEPMPAGQPPKEVKQGGWLTYNENDGKVYAAKGYKTTDFYWYDPEADSWSYPPLPPMPYASHPNEKWARKVPYKGSKGCWTSSGVIYVTQGNNTLGFWSYHPDGDSWHVEADVPEGPE